MRVCLTFKALSESELSQVPESDRAIDSTAGRLVAVLGEGEAAHGRTVAGQGVRVFHGADVPDAQRTGGGASAEDKTIGVEGTACVLGSVRGSRGVRALQEEAATHVQEVPAVRRHRYQVVSYELKQKGKLRLKEALLCCRVQSKSYRRGALTEPGLRRCVPCSSKPRCTCLPRRSTSAIKMSW